MSRFFSAASLFDGILQLSKAAFVLLFLRQKSLLCFFWAGGVFPAGRPAFDLHHVPDAVEIFRSSAHLRPLCHGRCHLVLLRAVAGDRNRGKELEEMA